ncbi:MAG: DeoR/GlpR family DNA-binding transcription regulator [Anaerolineales bacterium]|jgi:DeoR/GlpR family transcriptional regulator of sugar metabolism
MRDMLAEQRRLRITEYVQQQESGIVTIAELSEMLSVSDMTIRRDLDLLERQSVLRKVRGGAAAIQQIDGDRSFDFRSKKADPQKKIIGWLASQLVHDGDRIVLDAGTTTFQIASNLACKNHLTVITNNLLAAQELSRCTNIIILLLGGIIKHQELCTVGDMVKQSLSLLSVDKYFLSVTSFSIPMGAMETDMAETEVKQSMLRSAGETILVADSTKYNVTSLIQVAPLRRISKIVTDDGMPVDAIREIEAQDVEVITPARQSFGPIPSNIKTLVDYINARRTTND